jgi:hypothetical protein
VNTVGGAITGAAKTVIGNAVTGQPQNATQTATAAATGAVTAAVFSAGTQGAIARGSTATTTALSNSYGVTAGTTIKQPSWTGAAGIIGENVLPTVLDVATATKNSAQGGKSR